MIQHTHVCNLTFNIFIDPNFCNFIPLRLIVNVIIDNYYTILFATDEYAVSLLYTKTQSTICTKFTSVCHGLLILFGDVLIHVFMH